MEETSNTTNTSKTVRCLHQYHSLPLEKFFTKIFAAISNDNQINLESFENFFDLPIIISDKLFSYFLRRSNSSILDRNTFVNNCILLYSNTSIEEKIIFFVNFFDFNNNGITHIEHFRLIFYYFHSITNHSPLSYVDQFISEILPLFNTEAYTQHVEALITAFKQKQPNLLYLFYYYFNSYQPFNAYIINYICNYNTNNNNTNSVNTIQTSAFYLQGSYELERYVQLECNSRNVNDSSFISNQMTNSIDCFDDIISFVPEYIIINYDSVYPLKHSFVEYSCKKITLYLLNENALEFDVPHINSEHISKFVHLYNHAHPTPKVYSFYSTKKLIGIGSYGVIELVQSIQTGQLYAMKKISKETKKINLKWEKDICKLLKNNPHPNIIKVYDIFETRKFVFIILEYIHNRSLREFLANKTELLTPFQIKKILIDIMQGLKFLNKFYILHRDLKPANILMKNNKQFIITDFGFGKVLPHGETTSEGFGTLSYASPEILLKIPYNHFTDLWSIGIISYYLMYGKLPFDDEKGNDMKSIANKIISVNYIIPIQKHNNVTNFYNKTYKFYREYFCSFGLDVLNCFLKYQNQRMSLSSFLERYNIIVNKQDNM